MRGDVSAIQSSWLFAHEQRERVIRFFVSSTFTDSVHERAVLQRCVLPAVIRISNVKGRISIKDAKVISRGSYTTFV